jgi:mannose-6-phosphate isomerase-like protein (cupin superfamily)
MSEDRSYVLEPGRGERVALPDRGAVATVKADRDRTRGLFGLVESAPAPGEPGLAPHRHRHADEALYVLEGQIRARVGDETRIAGPGTFIYIARGTVHAFANAGSGPARLLVFFVPAGLEQYLRETAAAYDAGTPGLDVVAALRRRHDVEMA